MNKIIINIWWIIRRRLSAKIGSLVGNCQTWRHSYRETHVETRIVIDLANPRDGWIWLKSIKISFPLTSSPKGSIQQGTCHQSNSIYPKICNKPPKSTKRQNHKDCIILPKRHHSSAILKNKTQSTLANQAAEPNSTTVSFRRETSPREMPSPSKAQES